MSKYLIIEKDRSGLMRKDSYILSEAEVIPHTKLLLRADTFVNLTPFIKKELDSWKSTEELISENKKLKERIKELENLKED